MRNGSAGDSGRTVVFALVVNALVAVAKMAAGVVTGSSAVVSEGWHAVADTGNEAVLLVARKRSRRPPNARHPLGYGREAYFWALIAAVGVFVAGGLLSLRQGVEELLHATSAATFWLAYVVLAVATVFESMSLAQASRQLHAEATERNRGFIENVHLTSEPTTRAVFAEDAAAVIGNIVAFVGVAVHQVTGSAVPDGLASLTIGLLLGGVGVGLAARNRDFLIGEPAPGRVRNGVEEILAAQAGIVSITDLVVVFIGPRQVWVAANVDIVDSLTGAEVERLIRAVTTDLRERVPVIARVDIVPSGPRPGSTTPLAG